MPDEVTTALDGIRQRNEQRITSHRYTAWTVEHEVPEGDVRRLLAVADAVLALAAKLEPQAPSPSALEEDRMWMRQQCADMIREAISRALLSKEEE